MPCPEQRAWGTPSLPAGQSDRRMINEQVIGAHAVPGQGLFVTALQRQLAKRRVTVHFGEYDFAETSRGAR
jgi:hypothetical protein